MKRLGSAIWRGSIKDGRGTVSAGSGAFVDMPYSYSTRFEDKPGTNPEELIAAAHAACFSMALSVELGKKNITPTSLDTTAVVTMEQQSGQWTVTSSHLEVSALVPKMDQSVFMEAANAASANCPVSRLLNTKITLQAELDEAASGEIGTPS